MPTRICARNNANDDSSASPYAQPARDAAPMKQPRVRLQQETLRALSSMMRQYVSASLSVKTDARDDAPRRVTLAALLACFDAVARLLGSPKPLVLSCALTGRLEYGRPPPKTLDEALGVSRGAPYDTLVSSSSLLGVPLETLLEIGVCASPAQLRLREAVIAYWDGDRESERPYIVLGDWNLLSSQVSFDENDEQDEQARRISQVELKVDRDELMSDAFLVLVKALLASADMLRKPPSPTSYLNKKLFPKEETGSENDVASKWLAAEWNDFNPEFGMLRDMIVLYKFGVSGKVLKDWRKHDRFKRASDIAPGFYVPRKSEGDGGGGGGGKDKKFKLIFWLGHDTYRDADEPRDVKGINVGSVTDILTGLRHDLFTMLTADDERAKEEKKERIKQFRKKPERWTEMITMVPTEEEVLLATDLPLAETLGDENAELLLTYLLAPHVSLPLTLRFFEPRVRFLVDATMQEILSKHLFEPIEYAQGGGDSGGSNGSSIPCPPKERHLIGTPLGILSCDIERRPCVIISAVTDLCNAGAALCVVDVASSYVGLLCYFVIIATTVERVALCTFASNESSDSLSSLEGSSTSSSGPTDQSVAAIGELKRLRSEFLTTAAALLHHWIDQAIGDTSNLPQLVNLHCHLALIHGGLLRDSVPASLLVELGHGSSSTLADTLDVSQYLESLAFVMAWSPGVRGELKAPSDALLGDVVMSHQEARTRILTWSNDAFFQRDDRWLSSLEKFVASALKLQCSGQDLQSARDATSEADDAGCFGGWEIFGARPVECMRVVTSPGWREGEPYPPNSECFEEVSFPGVMSISILFDPETSTEPGEDFITIYKDSSCTDYWGTSKVMSGRPCGDDRLGAIPEKAIVLPTDRCFVHFKSDPSGGDKGFSVTISAVVNEEIVKRLCQECGSVLSDADMTTRLGIARAALQTCEHDFEKACGFIMGNAKKLRERAAKARDEAAQDAVGGVYRHRQSRFTVNFQLGEVTQDGEQLVPVPSRMTDHDEYKRLLGTSTRWCSIKSEQPGAGLWIELLTIDARYDVMLHQPFRPVTEEVTRAMCETKRLCNLICESDKIRLETGDVAESQEAARAAVKECILTALDSQLSPEHAVMVSRLRLCDSDVRRLADAMVESGCDSIGVLSVIDDKALRPVVERVKPPLPLPLVSNRMHRNLLVHLLRTGAEERMRENVEADRVRSRGRPSRERRDHRLATGSGRNLGGWDTLSIANALRQDATGRVCWLGSWFKPIRSDELPNTGPHGWLSVAFKHLFGIILRELGFNDEPYLYLLEEGDDVASVELSRSPLLMYQWAIGDLTIVSQHPGQFWEVYRPHERRTSHFCVDALVVHAERMHRETVYTSDSRHTFSELQRSDTERQAPTPEYQRYAQGFLFSPLFDDGNDQTTQTPLRTLSMRRTPGERANAADKRAIERAGLNNLGSANQWAAQELVPSTCLRPLLPQILVETFEFWAAGPSLIWGYPLTELKLKREAKIKKARKKGADAVSKATTREWYDGIALLIELIQPCPATRPAPPPRRRRQTLKSAIVHRVAWDGA